MTSVEASALPGAEPARKRRRVIVAAMEGPADFRCRHYLEGKQRCAECRFMSVKQNDGRTLDYVSKGLRMGEEGIRMVKRLHSMASFALRKLHLVLDLDHTLLHAKLLRYVTPEERYLIEGEGLRGDVKVMLQNYLVKFRPFLFDFLREANQLFELSVYTKATRDYAMEIVRFLDPQGTYFRAAGGWDRVITRDESPAYKTLDLVLADERGVIVVDDSQVVWPGNQENLLVIPPYKFFVTPACSTSYSVQRNDETEANGWLATFLHVLKVIHASFFQQESDDLADSRDVRPIIREKLEVLLLR